MGKFRIYPMCLGNTVRDKSNAAYGKEPGTKVDLPLLSFYITDGVRRMVVDTGGDPADGTNHMPYTQEAEDFLDKRLAALGVACGDIDTVILTHLHWDHASNNHLFPNATFYVQKTELQYAAAPLVVQRHLYDQRRIFQTRYEILEGDAGICDGVSVAATPGHTPGSQTVLVDTEAGVYALVGDLVSLYQCWEASPKIANGLHTDLEAYYQTYRRLEGLCDHVLPGHEKQVLALSVYPTTQNNEEAY